MSENAQVVKNEDNVFEVITYDEEAVFKYTLPDEDEERTIECELTFVWEDTLEKFIEQYGDSMPYKINTFKYANHHRFFLQQIENRMDQQIEEVEEEIANKMKYGFEFTGQLHNDD